MPFWSPSRLFVVTLAISHLMKFLELQRLQRRLQPHRVVELLVFSDSVFIGIPVSRLEEPLNSNENESETRSRVTIYTRFSVIRF